MQSRSTKKSVSALNSDPPTSSTGDYDLREPFPESANLARSIARAVHEQREFDRLEAQELARLRAIQNLD